MNNRTFQIRGLFEHYGRDLEVVHQALIKIYPEVSEYTLLHEAYAVFKERGETSYWLNPSLLWNLEQELQETFAESVPDSWLRSEIYLALDGLYKPTEQEVEAAINEYRRLQEQEALGLSN